jgi:hypothetical protein
MATEQEKANLTTTRGRQAASMSDSDERKAYIAGSANVDKDYQSTAEETANVGNSQQKAKIMSDYGVARDARK